MSSHRLHRRLRTAVCTILGAVLATATLTAFTVVEATPARAATPRVSIAGVDTTITEVGGQWGYEFGFVGNNAVVFSLKLTAPVTGATWRVTSKPAIPGSRSFGTVARSGKRGTAYFMPGEQGTTLGTTYRFKVQELDRHHKVVATSATSWRSESTLSTEAAADWHLDSITATNGNEAFLAGQTYHLSGADWPADAKVKALVAVVDETFNPLDGDGYLVAGNQPQWQDGYPVEAVRLKPIADPSTISFTVPESAAGRWVYVVVDGQAPGKWDNFWIGSNANYYAIPVVSDPSDDAQYLKQPWAE